MAPWGDTKLFFCILFITCCCYCTVTFAQMPMDCCLSVKNRTIDKQVVAGYRRQYSGQGCSIDAMIFVTRRGRKLCVPHDKPWVQDLVKHVIFLEKYCKKHNYKADRCVGVPHQ
nr:chemokine (C-C motif) ligand 19a [Sebastes schlegelii]